MKYITHKHRLSLKSELQNKTNRTYITTQNNDALEVLTTMTSQTTGLNSKIDLLKPQPSEPHPKNEH